MEKAVVLLVDSYVMQHDAEVQIPHGVIIVQCLFLTQYNVFEISFKFE